MTISKLKRLYNKKLINLSGVAREANLNYNTLLGKIINNRELKVTESEAIEKALEKIK